MSTKISNSFLCTRPPTSSRCHAPLQLQTKLTRLPSFYQAELITTRRSTSRNNSLDSSRRPSSALLKYYIDRQNNKENLNDSFKDSSIESKPRTARRSSSRNSILPSPRCEIGNRIHNR